MLVPKGQPAPGNTANAFYSKSSVSVPSVKYRTHVQDYGWQKFVANGQISGTTGQGKRLEATTIQLANQDSTMSGSIQYQTHIQNIGWQGWTQNGGMSGTSGRALRLEAIRIKLSGNIANYYRVHAQNFGWLGWAANGQDAGTAGYGYRLEGMQVVLVPKGQPAPENTANPSYTKVDKPAVTPSLPNGAIDLPSGAIDIFNQIGEPTQKPSTPAENPGFKPSTPTEGGDGIPGMGGATEIFDNLWG